MYGQTFKSFMLLILYAWCFRITSVFLCFLCFVFTPLFFTLGFIFCIITFISHDFIWSEFCTRPFWKSLPYEQLVSVTSSVRFKRNQLIARLKISHGGRCHFCFSRFASSFAWFCFDGFACSARVFATSGLRTVARKFWDFYHCKMMS